MGFGVHFSEDRPFAMLYANDEMTARKGKSPALYTAELLMRNPINALSIVTEGSPEFTLAKKLGGKKLYISRTENGTPCAWMQHAIDATSPERALRLLREAGYDSVIYEAKVGTPGVNARITAKSKCAVVFSSDQIRILSVELNPTNKSAQSTRQLVDAEPLFQHSKAINQEGQPLMLYRGEHGARDLTREDDKFGDFQSRCGSLSFSTYQIAHHYATSPNYRGDSVVDGRISAAILDIQNPFVNSADSFLEMGDVITLLGDAEARRIALKFSDAICKTDNWRAISSELGCETIYQFIHENPDRLSELYFDAYLFFDDKTEVARLKKLGYDGAIHGGNGESALEKEYKVFSKEQVRVIQTNVQHALTRTESEIAIARAAHSLLNDKSLGDYQRSDDYTRRSAAQNAIDYTQALAKIPKRTKRP